MAACDTLEELLQAHLDGELAPEEAATVDAHLPGCAGCREAVDELRVLGERLGELFVAREQEAASVAVPGIPAAGAAARPATQRVFGGYRLEQEIARGGMGTVHRAVQLSMDRPVALKVLAPRLAEDEEFVARFLREAKVAATLSHPNLVTIYDVGREGGTLFYSMELVEGEDAEAAMKRHGGHLPPRQAVEAALGAARALEAARQAGIVHRDVKPANILLTPGGGVKLTDLGLAKATEAAAQGRDVGSLTLERKVIGSPNYMSPEQAGDLRAATHRSDVYSLGATLLHLLTGQTPFAGGSPIEVIARVLRDPPALPERLPGGEPLDADLRRTLARALEKDPAARHATA
ncbi:MAG: protein kinase, partial [Planctomycetes bacterium]|nr:protein kinase [Planctomycetota bacterium]